MRCRRLGRLLYLPLLGLLPLLWTAKAEAQISLRQGDGVAPIRTWCLSPGADFCLSVTYWFFDLYGGDNPDQWFANGYFGYLSGSEVTADLGYPIMRLNVGFTFDAPCSLGEAGFNRDSESLLNETDNFPKVSYGNPGRLNDCMLTRAPTVDDVTMMSIGFQDRGSGGITQVGSCSPYDGTCFTPTPEPGSSLLLATGLTALLGLTALRRRRQILDPSEGTSGVGGRLAYGVTPSKKRR